MFKIEFLTAREMWVVGLVAWCSLLLPAPATPTQHSRARRQAGDKVYEYDSEEVEAGDWGEWAEPGPCSRTCGGGVSTEQRSCAANQVVQKREY